MPAAAAVLVVMMAYQASAVASDRARDESEIRQLQARQLPLDLTASPPPPSDDVHHVAVIGEQRRVRDGVVAIPGVLTAAYAVAFRESRLTVSDVEVKFLARDVAVAHVRWTMTGARTPPAIPEPRQGIQIQVLHKRGNVWRIAAFQNTNSVPEVPF